MALTVCLHLQWLFIAALAQYSSRVGVCVCVTLGVIGMLLHLFLLQQGVAADHLGPLPTKTPT